MLNARFHMCARALLYTDTSMAQQSGVFLFCFKIGRAALSLALCAPLRKKKLHLACVHRTCVDVH